MSVSSGSDITIPIQDSPPPPPSPYAGSGGAGSKGNANENTTTASDNVTIIDTTGVSGDDSGKKTPEPRGDVTVTVGFVNEAYQNHSPDQTNEKASNGKKNNGAISIAVAGPNGNEKGDGNGETTAIHLNEAVNPELINMNILNTIPDKPNPEYGPYDNMDEYFVPVNQHKKFLRRSEKLYVTKDKRKETRWKKYICWLVGATILATIVTVAVLAGIGLIPQKSPSNFETDSVVGTEIPHASNDSGFPISTSPHSVIPSSTEINTPPTVPQDATYVPMAADINFHIVDLGYEPAFNDKNSERFQSLAKEIQDEVKDVLKERAGLNTVYSRVSEFAPGSVYVKMRIGWLDQSMDFQRVKLILSNVTTVGSYNVLPISSYEVVNLCKFNKNSCSHNCSYDYKSMEFYCFCLDDTYYLAEDNKTCRSMYEATSSSTTTTTTTVTSSEEPFMPEVISSSEGIYPSASPASIETGISEETVMPSDEVSEEAYPTSLPVDEHEHEHNLSPSPIPRDSEEEYGTEGNYASPETIIEPVSHEQHVPHDEMVPVGSSTTSTTETPSEEPISEEAIEPEHDRYHDLGLAFGTTTSTTTTTTTEAPMESISSSEEVISEHTEQPQQPASDEGETTMMPESREQQPVVDSTERYMPSSEEQEPPKSSSEESTYIGRTDISDENVRPTETVPEVASEEPIEVIGTSSENATLAETVRHTSGEDEMEQVLPTAEIPTVPESKEEEPEPTSAPVSSEEEPKSDEPLPQTPEEPEPTSAPVSSEEEPKSEEPQPQTPAEPESRPVAVPDVEVATVVPNLEEETDEVAPTTVLPVEEEKESDQPHLITPMDVLSFSSAEKSSTTPSPPAEPASPASNEHEEGRSLSGENSAPESASVETIAETGPVRSENLTDDETVTESGQMEDSSASREPRLYSNEMTNTMQFLGENDEEFQKSKTRESVELAVPVVAEVPQQTTNNVTESASVETADETPVVASDVTSTSSETGASGEAVTQNTSGSNEEVAPEQKQNNDEDSTSVSGSVELSQESPVQVSAEEGDSDSGERATFTPLSLHHDIDVNYIGNLTTDPVNSEPVSHEVNGDVEHVEGVNEAVQVDKEKLVQAPEESDEMLEATTMTAPVDNIPEDKPASSEHSGPVSDSESQPESDISPIPNSRPSSNEELPQITPVPVSSETIPHSESQEGTRGITSVTDLSGSAEESLETPNRDHRDTEEDLESPFSSVSSSASAESHENYGDEFSKLIEELTTVPTEEVPAVTVTTTTSTTTVSPTSTTTTTLAPVPETTPVETTPSTTTTTTLAPLPETTPAETTTSTTTTTTEAPVPETTPVEISTSTTTTEPTSTSTSTTAAPVSSVEEVSSSPSNSSSSPSINLKSGDSLSQESASLSVEHSNSHHVENSHELSASREELGGPISASNEGASSLSSLGDNNINNSSDDLHDNELT